MEAILTTIFDAAVMKNIISHIITKREKINYKLPGFCCDSFRADRAGRGVFILNQTRTKICLMLMI